MENRLPKISIIIPVYGVEAYIEDCIRSVIRQDYPGELECVVVNDCSPDNSMEIVNGILKSYSGDVKFVVVEHEKNRGLSAARNTGMDKATGEYVYFLDSDDEITPDCCSVLAGSLRDCSYDMVVADYKVVGTEKSFPSLSMKEGALFDSEEIKQAKINSLWYSMAVNKLYKRNFLQHEGLTFKEGLIHEDELWSAEIACTLRSMYAIPSHKTYVYKIRENSITTNNNYSRRLNAFETIIEEFDRFLSNHNLRTDIFANQMLLDFFYISLSMSLRDSKRVYLSYYGKVQKKIHVSYKVLSRINHGHLFRRIRDIHFFLPSVIAKWHYWFLYKVKVSKYTNGKK